MPISNFHVGELKSPVLLSHVKIIRKVAKNPVVDVDDIRGIPKTHLIVDDPVSVIPKHPHRNETVADCLINGSATDEEREVFHECICRHVSKLVKKYYKRTIHKAEFNDLVQECFAAIMHRLHSYRSDKAKLTTWTYFVCRSSLNRVYNAEKEQREAGITFSVVHENIPTKLLNVPLKLHLKQALLKLFGSYPRQQRILTAMFGNPRRGEYQCPDKVCCAKVARQTGINYPYIHAFYRNDVVPFLKNQLTA